MSDERKFNVELTGAEVDIICVGLNRIRKQYPKVVPLMHRLDELFEKPAKGPHVHETRSVNTKREAP